MIELKIKSAAKSILLNIIISLMLIAQFSCSSAANKNSEISESGKNGNYNLSSSEPDIYPPFSFKLNDNSIINATVTGNRQSKEPEARIVNFTPALKNTPENISLTSKAIFEFVYQSKIELKEYMATDNFDRTRSEYIYCWHITNDEIFCVIPIKDSVTKDITGFQTSYNKG